MKWVLLSQLSARVINRFANVMCTEPRQLNINSEVRDWARTEQGVVESEPPTSSLVPCCHVAMRAHCRRGIRFHEQKQKHGFSVAI